MSTDYVFGGDKTRSTPYVERTHRRRLTPMASPSWPASCSWQYLMDRYYILRVCGLYGVAGSAGKGGNFVELMLAARSRRQADQSGR